ncbi:MAG: transglutaminase domain-containing protein [Patescibacteria group bacterium]|jgi:hypothetical protein
MNNIKNLLKRFFISAKEKIGFPRYLQSRKYAVSYAVKLKNLLGEPNEIILILPTPENLSGQEILSVPELNLKPDMAGREEKYGNNYAVWKLAMKAGEEKEVKMDFSVKVRPRMAELKKGHEINDYAKDEIYKLYTRSNNLIHPEDEKIKSLAKKISGAEKDVLKILKAINSYIVSNLKYGAAIDGLYSDLDALKKPEVDCGGFSALYASLAMASGIPSRVVSGFWVGYKDNTMHAWAESLLPDGTFIPADPATEQLRKMGRTKKFGRFAKIGSDRIILSKGCDLKINAPGGKMIETDILQNPIAVAEKGKDSFECSWELNA